jgi:hypothetical protein
MERGVNVLALVKEGERDVFLYDDQSSAALLQTLGRYAANPELSFSWYDAAVLSQKVRKLKREEEKSRNGFRESAR